MPRLKHTRKWLEDKPVFVGWIALSVVSNIDTLKSACEAARDDNPDVFAYPLPPPKEWKRFYRNRRAIVEACLSAVGGERIDGREPQKQTMQYFALGAVRRMAPEVVETEIREAWADGSFQDRLLEAASQPRRLLEECLTQVEEGAENSTKTPCSTDMAKLLFFLRVLFPCWIYNGKSHTRLLREARGGNIESIEKLLRLDKRVLEDARIRQRIYEMFECKRTGMSNRVHCALKRGSLKTLSMQKLKVLQAALILKVSIGMESSVAAAWGCMDWPGKSDPARQRLTAPDIRRLFDAWAKDTQGRTCDYDLRMSDEAFYKALRRDLPFWTCLPEPGQK